MIILRARDWGRPASCPRGIRPCWSPGSGTENPWRAQSHSGSLVLTRWPACWPSRTSPATRPVTTAVWPRMRWPWSQWRPVWWWEVTPALRTLCLHAALSAPALLVNHNSKVSKKYQPISAWKAGLFKINTIFDISPQSGISFIPMWTISFVRNWNVELNPERWRGGTRRPREVPEF